MIDPSQKPLLNNAQHSQGTSMYPAEFEPAIRTIKRPQTALGHTATSIGQILGYADI
jgi:hypothetical protein